MKGIVVGGAGVGAGTRIVGLAVAGGLVGSKNLTGMAAAGGYLRIEDGTLRGVSISAVNDIRGSQRGLTIGIVNYAAQLHGVQLGLVNIARNNPAAAKILPVANVNL